MSTTLLSGVHISFTAERDATRAFNGRCDMTMKPETTDAPSSVPAANGGTMKAGVQEGAGAAGVLPLRGGERPTLTDDPVVIRGRAASVNALDRHTTPGRVLPHLVSPLFG